MKMGAGMVGATGAGALGAYYSGVFSTNENSIRSKLIKNKWVVLEDSKEDHKSRWGTSLSKYKGKYTNKDSLSEDQLKGICKDLLNSEDDKNYEEARRYCVVPRTISERLSDLDFKLLNITTGASNNGDQQKWTDIVNKYKAKGTDTKELDDLKANSLTTENTNWSTLKDKCKSVSEKDHWSEKYDLLVENSKTWCTLQGFDNLSNV
ncbi:hypothetical protein HF1_08990 [Mycoplasma haemofelis str. Langford 1]|uniref:Uncharacterized protein n=1 Tax=Mycoplasma haemofelis (strain Langford 1) TaxID=941640 RepID=E8ZID6_MYCHL|nr:hypothetical protein [Mycoplasma haemofelis]CBY92907.1 hypothetical protein HF1_08990 [Mycoplasma haemofelis str. Langford 1]